MDVNKRMEDIALAARQAIVDREDKRTAIIAASNIVAAYISAGIIKPSASSHENDNAAISGIQQLWPKINDIIKR